MEKLRKIYEDIEAGSFEKEAGTVIVLIPGDKEIDCACSVDTHNEKEFICSMIAIVRYAVDAVAKEGKEYGKGLFVEEVHKMLTTMLDKIEQK